MTHDRRWWIVAPDADDSLDPTDEDDRNLLIEGEHPGMVRAIEQGRDEIRLAGQPVNPRLHFVMHAVVANQIWNDDPPETYATAERLAALGHERHEVLHMLASVVSSEVWGALSKNEQHNRDRFVAKLEELPGAWEAIRPSPAPARRRRSASSRPSNRKRGQR